MPEVDKEELEKMFAPFLAAHKFSKISETKSKTEHTYIIERPWDDESLIMVLPDDDAEDLKKLSDALNGLILPVRFSAIYHVAKRDLEVIWTAYKVSSVGADLLSRRFTFDFEQRNYVCEFADSSPEVLELGKCTIPIRRSDTGYRNLDSIQAYAYAPKDGPARARLDKPRSFWIRDLDWNEDAVVDLAYHINFYMSYFDDKTSKIIVHPTPEISAVNSQTRYIKGQFPSQIKAKTIDPNILHFWNAAHGADDQAKSFLYYYRLIEYASSSFIDAEARGTVRRILAQPNVLDDVGAIYDDLTLAIQITKKEEESRILDLLKDTLNKKVLWKEVENNIGSFTAETRFEGGFTLDPLVAPGAKFEQFDLGKFTKHTKDIRNALSHGRDIRTQTVIIPTSKNFVLLQPWVSLMCIVAGEVVLFKSVS
jgi:hypothetical protein